jgi:hypothetical protein
VLKVKSVTIDFGIGALETLRLPANRATEGPRTIPTCNYHQYALIELCPEARHEGEVYEEQPEG